MLKRFFSVFPLVALILMAAGCNRPSIVRSSDAGLHASSTSLFTNDTSTITSITQLIPPQKNLPLHTVGQVTRHAKNFVNQTVQMQGYLLKKENSYLIFSDEPTGAISSYDLPVVGSGISKIQFKHKYTLEGRFMYGGLNSSNHNLYHLELVSMSEVNP